MTTAIQTLTAPLQPLTRGGTSLWLQGVRIPLTIAEQIAKPEQGDAWGPTLAFAQVEIAVKEAVGRLTGDEVLLGAARLQRTEVERRTQAVEKRAEAEQARAEAERKAQQRDAELERQREAAEARAETREQQLEREKAEAERAVAREKAEREQASRKLTASHEKVLEDKALKADQQRLEAEAEALRAKEQAVAAEGQVLDLDEAVRTTKAVRKAARSN